LRKPLSGAGGRGIAIWAQAAPEPLEPYYFQRRVMGDSVSAQFVATADGAEFLGATAQLIGLRGVHAAPFAWCGNLFPIEVSPAVVSAMQAVGNAVAQRAGLRGLFGCDFVVSENVPWLTEVNPRYTAAMELIEHRQNCSLIARHVAACQESGRSGSPGLRDVSGETSWRSSSYFSPVVGKIVLFADGELTMGDARMLLLDPLDDRLPFVADLPPPGATILAGHPVCTLFAYDSTPEACTARLLHCAKLFRRRFLNAASP
jgi:predicted ATP-grasp superfamily ATP-dependent carboligase